MQHVVARSVVVGTVLMGALGVQSAAARPIAQDGSWIGGDLRIAWERFQGATAHRQEGVFDQCVVQDVVVTTGSGTYPQQPGKSADTHPLVARDARNGALLWELELGFLGHLAADPTDSAVFVTGVDPGENVVTRKLDSTTGVELWSAVRTTPGSLSPKVAEIVASPTGDRVFIAGSAPSPGSLDEDFLTIAYDAKSGAELWTGTLGGTAQKSDAAVALAVSAGGRQVIVTGRALDSVTKQDYLTVCYDAASGAQLWTQQHGTSGSETATSVATGGAGGIAVVVGAPTTTDAVVAYGIANGQQLWSADFSGELRDVLVSPDETKVFVTARGGAGGGASHVSMRTACLDAATGGELWSHDYLGTPAVPPVDGPSELALSPLGDQLFVTGKAIAAGEVLRVTTLAFDVLLGNVAWSSVAEPTNPADGIGARIDVGPDGSHVLVAARTWAPTTQSDMVTVALDARSGALVFSERYDSTTSAVVFTDDLSASHDGRSVYTVGRERLGQLPKGLGLGGGIEPIVTTARDASTGETLWTSRLDLAGFGGGTPYDLRVSPDDETVYVAHRMTDAATGAQLEANVVAYDARDGDELWTASGGSGFSALEVGADVLHPTDDGTRLIVSGSVHAYPLVTNDFQTTVLDATNGATLWSDAYDPGADGYPTAVTATRDADLVFVAGRLVASGPSVVPPTGILLAYDGTTGAVEWTASLPGENGGNLFVEVSADQESVFVASDARLPGAVQSHAVLAKYDAVSGALDWIVQAPLLQFGWFSVTGFATFPETDVVYLLGYGGIPATQSAAMGLFAFDGETGASLWTTGTETGFIVPQSFAVNEVAGELHVAGTVPSPTSPYDSLRNLVFDARSGTPLAVAEHSRLFPFTPVHVATGSSSRRAFSAADVVNRAGSSDAFVFAYE